MTLEMGKPIAESRGEVKYAAGFVEWSSFADGRSIRRRFIPVQPRG